MVDGIVTIQRDHGDRENRKYARMKYLAEAAGVEAFRAEVERRSGLQFALAPGPAFGEPQDYLLDLTFREVEEQHVLLRGHPKTGTTSLYDVAKR